MKAYSVDALYMALTIVLVGLNLVRVPFVSFLFLCGVAIVLYGFTKSPVVVLITLATPFVLQIFNSSMGITSSKVGPRVPLSSAPVSAPGRVPVNEPVPAGTEGFQVRDPVSIHKRIESVKQAAPKKKEPTGVLESAQILDNTPLLVEGMEGEPGVATPASVQSRNMIHPPSEESIPSSGQSRDNAPRGNPYLHNGPDATGVSVALAPTGTKLPPIDMNAGNMASTQSGAMGTMA